MAGSSSAPALAAEGKKKARIEIIPLIDVVFFLLATFVLFTLSLQRISAVDVVLPKADPNPRPPTQEDQTLYLQVSDSDTFYWKIGSNPPELISTSEIAPRLADYRNSQGEQARVLVRGDNRARFGAAVLVLDEVRKSGIGQVSVETIQSQTGR
ncbi:MAG: biopolymer transporter ExbD [Verrucomicrobiota bacterium]